MNFFASQAQAKTNTTRLVLLFTLAVIVLIGITQLFVMFVFSLAMGIPVFDYAGFQYVVSLLGAKVFFSTSFVIITVVFLASAYKNAQLANGGQAIAEAMNGKLINANSGDLDEKKILNVVEEMAIASGISVPPVYVIEENAINAFAAGHTSRDAVIGITRGCIKTLTRDELQGVVAHEFSHIFNGDMRLNIRLISVLYGILFIGMIGHFILRYAPNNSSRMSKDSKGVGIFLLLGIGLYIIGYAGTFFGNLIKAAVSRQREFLADASAVQFTRNPSGISNALKKIGGYAYGSMLVNPAADEISHLLFNQGVGKTFSGLMATHPPLEDRIKRIDPQWQGEYIKTTLPYSNPFISATTSKQFLDPLLIATLPESVTSLIGKPGYAKWVTEAPHTNALDSIGKPTEAHITEARKTLSSIPQQLMDAAHDSYSVRAIIYCLLLDKHRANIYEQQLALLKKEANPSTFKEVMTLKDIVALLPTQYRLPLLDICIPTLKQLRPLQYQAFKKKMLLLIKADNKIDLFEWSLYRITVHHLENTKKTASNKNYSLQMVHKECQYLLSAVALKSAKTSDEAATLFNQGWAKLNLGEGQLIQQALEDVSKLDNALKHARELHPLKKPQLIKACCASLKDNTQSESIELIRAIGDGLDVPIPPLLKGQSLC